jgi:hypothetical protein
MVVDQMMERSEGEWARHEPLQPTIGQRPFETERHRLERIATPRQEETDAIGQPPRHEREHSRRRGIEPLHVVDRHEDRGTAGE